jgi:hypothetical protein
MAVDRHASKPRVGYNSDAAQRLRVRYSRFRYFSRIPRMTGPRCRFGSQREEKCRLERVLGGSTAYLERLEAPKRPVGAVNKASAGASEKVGLLAQFTLVPNKASAMREANGKGLVVVTNEITG